MAYVADLHTHSRFAGACSNQLTIPNLSTWAKYKGIDLLGTGDALHPLYFQELEKTLEESGREGIYQYKETKFVVSTEINCIYFDQGKTRRVHILVYFPSLEIAKKVSEELIRQDVKLLADGRPITKLSARQLCELLWSIDKTILVIPAHIWTPWYGIYGSNSGYDSLQECFGNYTERIYAVETGLSSEPAMNWRVKELDNKSIVSFSDLHSLPRLGREVTIIGGSLSYLDLVESLKTQNIIGTIEFFPEEGKYHYSGHRKCNVVFDPEGLKKNGSVCPKCHRPLTIGVMQRVEELADRKIKDLRLKIRDGVTKSEEFSNRPGFRMLVQLEEIIAESIGMMVKSQKVQNEYHRLVSEVDTELKILTKTPIELLQMVAGDLIAIGVKKVREGDIKIEPGYDNTYGKVEIWSEEERKELESRVKLGMFG